MKGRLRRYLMVYIEDMATMMAVSAVVLAGTNVVLPVFGVASSLTVMQGIILGSGLVCLMRIFQK